MLPVVPTLEPVVGPVVPTLQIAVKAAVITPADPPPMGARMLVPELVVRSMVALFEAVVLPVMAMAPATVVRKRGRAQAQGDDGADHCDEGRTHNTLPS
jgi:hypothetical protein